MDEIVEPDENQVLVVHRHWVGLAPTAIALVLTAFIGGLGSYLLGRFGSGVAGWYAGLGLVALVLLGVVLAFASITVYRQNRLVITTKHIYMVTQLSLFSRKVSQCRLGELQDVNSSKRGALQTLLDYGNLTMETAGEVENFVFSLAGAPESLADRILAAKQQIEGAS